MKRIILILLLFTSCNKPENHGNLSIFKEPSIDQLEKWINVDSVYNSTIKEMINVYKQSAKLNFNGNPWENKKFQSKYSDLTWRGLYDYYKYFSNLYKEYGFQEGEKILDSINNRFDQFRDDIITWKEE